MKKLTFFSITLIVGIILFVLVINNVGSDKIIHAILSLKPKHFAVLISLSALSFVISSYRWKIILNANGTFTSFKKIMAAKLVGNSINYLTPSGLIMGEPFKAIILSKEKNIGFGETMVSVVVEAAIYLSTVLLFVMVGILSFFTYTNVSQKIFTIIIFAMVIMLFAFYLFYAKMIKKSSGANEKGFFTFIIDFLHLHKFSFINKLKEKITRREKEVKTFFSLHRKTIYLSIFLSIAELTVGLAMQWLIISFLGFSVNAKTLLGVYSLMNISNLLPLPGALGGFEISQVFAFNFFNIGGQVTALAFSLTNRIISLTFATAGILYLSYFQIKLLSKNFLPLLLNFRQRIKNAFRN